MAAERLTTAQIERVLGRLAAGDPHGEVHMAWSAKETLRGTYDLDPDTASEWIDEFIIDTTDPEMPPEVQRLGRTVRRWRSQILAWHRCRHTNGPTESMNNLAKRIKSVAFGFRSFTNFRVRALPYAGRPNWALLATITP